MLTFLLCSTLLNIPGGNLSKHGLSGVYQASRPAKHFSLIFNINRRDATSQAGDSREVNLPCHVNHKLPPSPGLNTNEFRRNHWLS